MNPLEFYSRTINQADTDGPPHSEQTPTGPPGPSPPRCPAHIKNGDGGFKGKSKAERERESMKETERRWEER